VKVGLRHSSRRDSEGKKSSPANVVRNNVESRGEGESQGKGE